MKKIILLIMFLIVIIPIVNSGLVPDTTITSYILEEDFNVLAGVKYNEMGDMDSRDINAFHNWTFSRTCILDDNEYPLNSSGIFKDFSFGTNYTSICSGGDIRIFGNLPVNISNSIIIMKYNYSIQEHNAFSTPLTISLYSYFNASNGIILTHGINSSDSPYNAVATVKGDSCNLSLTSDIPQTHEFTLIIDQTLNVFSWYADGVNDGNCDNVDFTGNNVDIMGLGTIYIILSTSNTFFAETYFDDLTIGTATTKSKSLLLKETSELTINSEGSLIMKK